MEFFTIAVLSLWKPDAADARGRGRAVGYALARGVPKS
jgi:hypothetical protein